MRLMASCSQVARACWSSGAILARNALSVGPIRPCVSRKAGVTTAGLYFVQFLALGDGGGVCPPDQQPPRRTGR